MDNIKHTPGPWEYDVTDFGNGKVEYGIFQPATQTPGDTVDYIATVHDDGTEATARLIAEAPAMLEALRSIMDGGSWQDDGSFVYYPPTDAPEDGGAIDDAGAILARIDGTPTAQPAENGPDGHCIHCGRDNRGHEGEPCSDDCPLYGEA